MSRYKVTGPWSSTEFDRPEWATSTGQVLSIATASITDKVNGDQYLEGAYRVMLDDKPAKRGKGGTVPFYGECAWMDANRLYDDIQTADRFAR